jgi:hypothetical protein
MILDTRFRLYLGHNIPGSAETVNVAEATRIVSRAFEGFTVYEAVGYWQGKAERSTVYEILACSDARPRIVALAQALKSRYRQDSVLMTVETVETVFL